MTPQEELVALRRMKDLESRAGTKPKAHDNGVVGSVMGALDGLQHHIVNAPLGVAQLAGHGMAAAVGGFAPEYAKRLLAQDKGLQQREQDYQGRTAGNAGSYVGATVGEVLPWMTGMGELRAAGMLPKAANVAQKIGLLSAEGGAMGLASPVTEDGSYAANKARQVGMGAVAAPLLHGTTQGLLAAGRGAGQAANYLTDAGRERIAQARVAQIPGLDEAALRNAPQYVPGEVPSIAQASPDPRVLQAERVLRNNPHAGPHFVAQDNANNQARMDVVQGLAGTDQKLADAVTARREATQPYYREHLQAGPENSRFAKAQAHLADFQQGRQMPMSEFNIIDQARKIAGQVQRGTIDEQDGRKAIASLQPRLKASQKALEQAQTIIDQNMVNPARIVKSLQTLSMSGNDVVRSAAKKHLGLLGEHMDANGGRVPAYALDDIRRNIGSTLASVAPNGVVGSTEGALYGPVSAKIASTLDRAVPGYRANLAAYTSHSQPIGDMQSARALRDAIDRGGRNASGDPVVNLSQIKSALGKNDRARFPMSPQAESALEGVLRSRQRAGISDNKIAASGPGTAAELQTGLLSSAFARKALNSAGLVGGGLLGHLTGIPVLGELAGAGLGSQLGEGVSALNGKVMGKVGEKAANAQKAADALEAYRLQQARKRKGLLGQLPSYLLPYAP